MAIFHSPVAQATIAFIACFLGFYLYHGLGVTLGYHRLLTHKALNVPSWLKYFIISGGYLSLMGSPIVWVGVHRLHHQKSDLEGDPHSPRKGFKYALYGWMFEMNKIQTDAELQAQTPELMSNKCFVWLGDSHSPRQAQLCLAFCIAFRILIYFTLGLIPLLANLVATGLSFWSPQFVNAFCHMPGLGYRSHETRDLSRNVWWIGILALGEGWHNNHHAIPKSARHGLAWFEVDITWYTIWLLEKIGLANTVIRPPKLSLASTRTKKSNIVVDNSVIPNNEMILEPAHLEPVSAKVRG